MNNTTKTGGTKGVSMKEYGKLATVNGYWIPQGITYRGKRVIPGIFVNVTGKNEEEQKKAVKLAREEIGERAKTLDIYGILDL